MRRVELKPRKRSSRSGLDSYAFTVAVRLTRPCVLVISAVPVMIGCSGVRAGASQRLHLSPSSRGPGRGPFKAKTRVRIPLGTPAFALDSVRRLPPPERFPSMFAGTGSRVSRPVRHLYHVGEWLVARSFCFEPVVRHVSARLHDRLCGTEKAGHFSLLNGLIGRAAKETR
jgi:hypothetical protein